MSESNNNNKIIKTFEEFVDSHKGKNYWKSIDEIANITSTTKDDVTRVIESCDEFVENLKDEYTTRKLYEKYTPFLTKFVHTYKGHID